MKPTSSSIYQTLFQQYGPQGWWSISGIYKKLKKLSEQEKWEVIIGTILTQNTSWTNVEKALANLRKNKCLERTAILAIERETLAAYIRSAGYFNQKAERLKIVAQFFTLHSFDELEQMEKENLRALLLSIKGIGPETADSILLYAFQKPSFVIDAYTKRILNRIGICKKYISYDELQKLMEKNLPQDHGLFNEYHALLVEHAKRYCKKKPNCNLCPLSKSCQMLI